MQKKGKNDYFRGRFCVDILNKIFQFYTYVFNQQSELILNLWKTVKLVQRFRNNVIHDNSHDNNLSLFIVTECSNQVNRKIFYIGAKQNFDFIIYI